MKRARSVTPPSAEEGNRLHLLLQVIDGEGASSKRAKLEKVEREQGVEKEAITQRSQPRGDTLKLPVGEALAPPSRARQVDMAVSTPPGYHFDDCRARWDLQMQKFDRESSSIVSTKEEREDNKYRVLLLGPDSGSRVPSGINEGQNEAVRALLEAGAAVDKAEGDHGRTALAWTREGVLGSSVPPGHFQGNLPAAKEHATSNGAVRHQLGALLPIHRTASSAGFSTSPRHYPGETTNVNCSLARSSCENYNYRLEDYAVRFRAVFQSKTDAVQNTPGAQIKKFQFIKEAYKEVVGREKDIRGGRKTKFDQMVESCFHEVTCIPKRTLKRKKQSGARVAVDQLPNEAISFGVNTLMNQTVF